MKKRYYWMKIGESFLNSAKIGLILREPNGFEAIFAFMRIVLANSDCGGKLAFEIEGELVPKTLEEVERDAGLDSPKRAKAAVARLWRVKLIGKEGDFYTVRDFETLVGSETKDAERMRKKRTDMRTESEHCSTDNKNTDNKSTDNENTDIREIEHTQTEEDPIVCVLTQKFPELGRTTIEKARELAKGKENEVGYAIGVLRNWQRAGTEAVGKKPNKFNYDQREYTDDDFKDFFYDVTKELSPEEIPPVEG